MTNTTHQPSAREVRELEARAIIAGDLFREGQITRAECFRLEVDAVLGQDSGPIRFDVNTDHENGEM